MAWLSLGVPDWHVELPAVAGQMIDAVVEANPALHEVYLRPAPFGQVLMVTVGRLSTSDRLGAVWSAARAVAGWWPGWLTEVDAVIWVPGLTVEAPAAAMLELAAGTVGRAGWLESCVVRPGN